jgi:hypothetical protein
MSWRIRGGPSTRAARESAGVGPRRDEDTSIVDEDLDGDGRIGAGDPAVRREDRVSAEHKLRLVDLRRFAAMETSSRLS